MCINERKRRGMRNEGEMRQREGGVAEREEGGGRESLNKPSNDNKPFTSITGEGGGMRREEGGGRGGEEGRREEKEEVEKGGEGGKGRRSLTEPSDKHSCLRSDDQREKQQQALHLHHGYQD
jgi:hypothetical protein